MSIRVFLHTSNKRAETAALLDSGATENFISKRYAQWLRLPFKRLLRPRAVYNVDGSKNKQGDIRFYTDLEVQTGEQKKNMRFFLTDLGPQSMILGYPWFAGMQPNIDWARGWLDYTQLPVVLRTSNAHKARFGSRIRNHPRPLKTMKPPVRVAYVSFPGKHQTMASKLAEQYTTQNSQPIPDEYKRHQQVFGEKESQRFPGPRIWDHAIELKPGAPPTIPGKIYALTQVEQKALESFVQEHLAKGYIRPSKSPYASPFFFIKKKDGKLRPVQDYRKINEWTIKNRYPLPLIPELIARVKGATLFTKFDVRWGYNNVRIKDGDQWKAAFITNKGLFEPNVMFFGLTNSPATFQMMMNEIFTEELREGWLTVYMDDMLNHTNDSLETHRAAVHRVLDKLAKHDLFLKPEKCLFEQRRMEFLGVVLENGTIQMDPAKIKGVEDWPQPKTVRDVRAFLGFTGFYRYFVPNYSIIARPLIDLTKKATPFHWDQPQQKAFLALKGLMCSHPVLKQPDYDKPFFLATDASAYGVGAVLSQEGDFNPRTKKFIQQPIAYYSATFTPTERNYDIYERELLAVIKALDHWRPHLAATEDPVTVLTDHANLTFWKNPRKVNRRVARWFSFLQDYNLVIKHVPGKLHAGPDMLSRPPNVNKGEDDNTDVTLIPPEAFIRTLDPSRPTEEEKREILQLYHDSPAGGHLGRDQTYEEVARHHAWPGMRSWIADYVRGCGVCQQNKPRTHPRKTPLYRIPVPQEANPFEVIALDLITHLPLCNGFDAILTIVDHGCSRAAIFVPCKGTVTGEGVADLYFDNVYRWFGLPAKVISDRDPRFTSQFTKALCARLGIAQNVSTAFHPQTDGLTERKNQWVEQFLRTITMHQQNDWATWLPLATAVHNRATNATTKAPPSEVLLGYLPRLDYRWGRETTIPRVEDRMKTAAQRREQAKTALNRVAQEVPEDQFRPNEKVWLEGKNLALPYQTLKLAPRRHGPFLITEQISPVAYKLALPPTWTIHDVFHASLLTPYRETSQHGANYTRPPPDLIEGEEEFEVEAVLNHRYHGRSRRLQYLVKWRGYPDADNSWEPVDQIFAPELITRYHQRRPLELDKRTRGQRKLTIRSSLQWPLPTLKPPTLPSSQKIRSLSTSHLLSPRTTSSSKTSSLAAPSPLAPLKPPSRTMGRVYPRKWLSVSQRKSPRWLSTKPTTPSSASAVWHATTSRPSPPNKWLLPQPTLLSKLCEPVSQNSKATGTGSMSRRNALTDSKRTPDESPTSSSRSTESISRPATSAVYPARASSKAPSGALTIASTSTSFMLNHPLPAKPPPTSSRPGSSRPSLLTRPPTPTLSTKYGSTATGAWKPRSSATTITTPASLSSKPRCARSRPRSIPAPYRSMRATTVSRVPTSGSASLPYRLRGPLTRAASTSAPPTHATASLAVVGQQPNGGVMSPAPRSSGWYDGAWVRWGANRSPDADRWFGMTRYSRFVT